MDTNKPSDIGPVTHVLKIIPPFFEDVKNRVKTFEVRRNDRDFKVNDHLLLQEFNSNVINPQYTGRGLTVKIVYILVGPYWGISDGFCVLGIAPVS